MTNIYLPVFGQLAWVDAILLAWFALTAISVIYVAYDAFTNNPEMKIMRIGWVLVTLYLGPISLFLYIMSCQEPEPGTHEEFVKPLWKQSLGSTIHCVAGDATGIVVAAALTAAFGLPMWIDLIVEYVGGFAFGLLIFQSLFMKDMMGGSYRRRTAGNDALCFAVSRFRPVLMTSLVAIFGMRPLALAIGSGGELGNHSPSPSLAGWRSRCCSRSS